ncbi:uncharacterized protein [Physcomitrium patens]|uniref:uncharacterized protein isoform X4 n=1 Tax=Physcomitrium patens TaxID=3218 RepID=UPI003CCD49D4
MDGTRFQEDGATGLGLQHTYVGVESVEASKCSGIKCWWCNFTLTSPQAIFLDLLSPVKTAIFSEEFIR